MGSSSSQGTGLGAHPEGRLSGLGTRQPPGGGRQLRAENRRGGLRGEKEARADVCGVTLQASHLSGAENAVAVAGGRAQGGSPG